MAATRPDAPSPPALLRTKLVSPRPRPDLVQRERLLRTIDDGLAGKLTLISAPAGSGKTTLIGKWASERRPAPAWISLDPADDDLTRFWSYVITALRDASPGLGSRTLASLHAQEPPTIEVLLTDLINEIVEAETLRVRPVSFGSACQPRGGSPEPTLVLVLDDFHLMASRAVHQSLAFFVDHLPPQMHLVISTRSDPALPLGRLRARGQISELRSADLRFTAGEAAAFLNETMGIGLSPDLVAAIDARTEGWAAGLQMAALVLQGKLGAGREDQGAAQFVNRLSGSHRFVLDYLADEVLSQQSSEVQSFLLRTAVLDRLCGALCNTVTGAGDGQAMLERLHAANLFVVPLDDERRWFRYHHLLADLLRKRLATEHPALAPALHLRASEWYGANSLIPEAVEHALSGGSIERASHLVGGNALSMIEHGDLASLEQMLDRLPVDVWRSQPWLLIARAWMLAFRGRKDAVDVELRRAEALIAPMDGDREDAAAPRWQRGHVACIRAFIADAQGRATAAVARGREAIELLPRSDVTTRSWAFLVVGLCLYRCGDMAAADDALDTAVALGRQTGSSHVAVLALTNLGDVQHHKGLLVRAADTFREALQLADEYAARAGRPLPVSGYARGELAALLCEWNQLDEALALARQGISVSELWGEPQLLVSGYAGLAFLLQAARDPRGALDAILKSRQIASTISPWHDSRMANSEALMRLRSGDLAAGSSWLAAEPDEGTEPGYVFEDWSRSLIAARVLIAQDRPDAALSRIAEVQQEAEEAGYTHYVIVSLALAALVRWNQGRPDDALAALQRALALARPQGYVRTFVAEGAPIRDLLQRERARHLESPYVDRLLAAFEREPQSAAVPVPAAPGSIEPLTPRERDVLRLLAAGLANCEIAGRLFLSVNTVKTHTRSIYGKLGVRNRLQAANRADELGLL